MTGLLRFWDKYDIIFLMKKAVKKYLIPHAENDYKPHLLRFRAIAFVCLVVIVAESAFLLSAKYLVPRSKLFGIIVANALIDETNHSRTAGGLSTLHENPLLDAAAQAKANDMAANNYFAHTSPAGLTPWHWFQTVGYDFNYAGENLAVNFSDSQDVTNAWMNSPEHRANILDADYNDIGMATAQGIFQGHAATYVVELFGTKAPTQVAANTIPGISTAKAATPTSTAATSTKSTTPTSTVAVSPAPASTTVNATSNKISVVQATTTNASSVVLGFVTSDNNTPTVSQTNAIQRILADPKTLANDFYIFLMILFGVALVLNVFIKIRVQHPRAIFGALLVIVVAGFAVLLNQSAVAHIAVL
jgi:hypothetical protein